VSTLRYDTIDGKVVTATSGGVIVVWSDSKLVGMTEGIAAGPFSIDVARERPRNVDDLAAWYARLGTEDDGGGATTYDQLWAAEERAQQAVLDAARELTEANRRRREFEVSHGLPPGGVSRGSRST